MSYIKANWRQWLVAGAAGYGAAYGVPPQATTEVVSALLKIVGLGG